MARFKLVRLRAPSLKTAVGITKATRRIKKASGFYAVTKPMRAPRNLARRVKRRTGYYSSPMKFLRALLGRR